jgi:tRNA-Thr(GGU) m(6)t(6)A37 methyltransferase TsaA
MDPKIEMHAIGVIASPVTDIGFTDWAEVVSEIRLDDDLVPGLRGLLDYSHIVVVFYLDRVHFNAATDLVRHPRDRTDWPLTGVFATRTQYRPNPIGVTTARLLGIQGNVLTVKGLDALEGTAVLDIKPYMPDIELAQSAVAPAWLT